MKVYLHAGMHKTGTSSLQHALLSSDGELRAIGYQVMVNPPQIMAKNAQLFDSGWLARQVRHAAAGGRKALIISAEAVSTFNGEQLRKIHECLHGFDPCVVIAFRHWNSFLPSRWKQNCQRRDTQSFFSYLLNMEKHEQTHIDANYGKVIENIHRGGFDNIRVLSYDNGQANGNLMASMLMAMDMPPAMAEHVGVRAQPVNTSRDTLFYDACRLFNGAYSLAAGWDPNGLFSSILQHRKVDIFYDFSGFVSLCEAADRDLMASVEEIIADTRIKTVLSAEHRKLQAWEQAAQKAVAEVLVNPARGMLFSGVSPVEVQASSIGIAAIPAGLRKRMVDYLRACMDQNRREGK